jgi:hypothetical protein
VACDGEVLTVICGGGGLQGFKRFVIAEGMSFIGVRYL